MCTIVVAVVWVIQPLNPLLDAGWAPNGAKAGTGHVVAPAAWRSGGGRPTA